jgi:NADH-quinone oxidoreductase subunit N
VVFFSLPVKICLMAVLFRLLAYTFVGLSSLWINLTLFCGVGSLVTGLFIVLQAKSIHAFIAGSGINHTGYMLCALSCNSILGYQTLFFYMLIYSITLVGFFSLLMILRNIHGRSLVSMSDLYVSQDDPFIRGCLYIIIFSFAGIPPLAGFFSKVFVITSLYLKGFTLVCVIIVITAIVASYYYIRALSYTELTKKLSSISPILSTKYKKGEIVYRSINFQNCFVLLILILSLGLVSYPFDFFWEVSLNLQSSGKAPFFFAEITHLKKL